MIDPELAQDPRGYTYSEAWRHECEVRFVLNLPTREARRQYIEGGELDAKGRPKPPLTRWRSAAAVDRLKADVATAWHAARAQESPRPTESERGAPAAAAVHPLSEPLAPGFGSFLDHPHAGTQTRRFPVDSGALER